MFFACGSSAPVRVEGEGGTVAWLVGTLGHQVCRDMDCLNPRSYGPFRVFFFFFFFFFELLVAGDHKASLASLSP